MTDAYIWVVELVEQRGSRMKQERDTKYVRAKTEEGAIRCARFHSMLPDSASAYARLATPQDLGCVEAA